METYWFALDDIDLTIVKMKGDPEDCYILPFGHTEWLRYRDTLQKYTLLYKIKMPEHPMDYDFDEDELPEEI